MIGDLLLWSYSFLLPHMLVYSTWYIPKKSLDTAIVAPLYVIPLMTLVVFVIYIYIYLQSFLFQKSKKKKGLEFSIKSSSY